LGVKRLNIQFAARGQSAGWISRGALAAAILVFAVSLWHYTSTRNEFERLDTDVRELSSTIANQRAAPTMPVGPAISPDRILAINGAIGQINLPWAELFQVFEANKPDTVALIAFEPDGKKRTIVVQAESRIAEDMIAFVERLRRVPFFEEAYLTKHELRAQDPNRPYRFTLDLRWRENT
jgi:hypothetical protein